MDIKVNALLLSFVRQLMDTETPVEPKINIQSEKPRFDFGNAGEQLPRRSMREAGVSEWRVASFLDELCSCPELDMHGITLIKDGAVIGEYGFGAYRTDVWHITHSECKSVTGLAIGMLIDEGKLSEDEKISDIFSKKIGFVRAILRKNVTVRDLLTMTSAVVFSEGNAMVSDDWVRDYFEASATGEPGKKFNYNSLNTYILSAIIREKTGLGLVEYLRPRLLDPLGIGDIHWEKCPKGTEKGGWGLYIRPEDIAKIGLLVLGHGVWNGKRLISEQWIEKSTSAQIATPESCGNYNYGYQIWVGRDENSFLFNGMFGQNVIGWFDTGYLLVSNAGNTETFQQSPFYSIADKYFGSHAVKDPKRANGKKLLKKAEKRVSSCGKYTLFDAYRTSRLCRTVSGATYDVKTGGKTVGLMPFMAQAMENCYTKGLNSVSFRYDKKLYITVCEKNTNNTFAVGFGKPEYTTLVFPDAQQLVGVTGKFAYDEDDNPVLKLRVSFLELANARTMRFVFMPDGTVNSAWNEIPGKEYVTGLASFFLERTRFASFLRKDDNLLEYRITRMLSPEMQFKREQ